MTTSAVNPTASPLATAGAAASRTDPLSDKNTFLQLLVTQLRHQDPLSPQDGTQFLAQLAQFTGLEKTIEIRDQLKTINDTLLALQAALVPAAPASPTAQSGI